MECITKRSGFNRSSKSILYFTLVIVSSNAIAIDWGKINGVEIMLLYPGQISLQWLQSSFQHKGAAMLEKGMACRVCHNDQEINIGEAILSDKTLDENPAKGIASAIPITVKAAHDGKNLFLQLQWTMPVEDKQMISVSVMFDDGSIPQFKHAGCWLACHSNISGMNKISDVKEKSKYLLASRDEKHASYFAEYWQANLQQEIHPYGIEGYIHDRRYVNKSTLVKSDAKYHKGKWTLTLSRELLSGEPYRKSFTPGKIIYFGIALHVGQHKGRYHLTSFEHTLSLDKGRADFIVKNQAVTEAKK